MINRRKFLTLLGAGFFVTFFSGCGETSKVTEGKIFSMEDIILNSGYKMPRLGLGTWTLDDSQAEICTLHALKSGYRLIALLRQRKRRRSGRQSRYK